MSVALCRLGTGFVAELLRHGLGDTLFHNGSLGLSATSMAGVGKGFNREPGGTLNSMTTGGTSYYYLTDALGSVVAQTDESGTKVSSYGYSPRGVQRGTTSEQVTQPCTGSQAATRTPRASTTSPPATTTRTSAASPAPTRPARRRIPTSTPAATPSSASTHSARSASAASGTRSASARSSRRLHRGHRGGRDSHSCHDRRRRHHRTVQSRRGWQPWCSQLSARRRGRDDERARRASSLAGRPVGSDLHGRLHRDRGSAARLLAFQGTLDGPCP